MRSIFVIAERELKSYFSSPVAYVVLTIFIFLTGLAFTLLMTRMVEASTERAVQSAQTGQPPTPMDMPGIIIQNNFGWIGFILLIIIPLLSMPLFSEEKKRGTMELLLTAPITDLQVVLGKFLAASTFYVILLLTTVVQTALLYLYATPASGPIFAAYLGILLYGLAILSVGMFVSTLTENQIVAGILSFCVILLLWLVDAFARGAGAGVEGVLNYLSIVQHLNDFLSGVISTSHIVFFLSLTMVGLFLTYRSLDSLRWRG
jgi:ABC-2 type transport system permease protein